MTENSTETGGVKTLPPTTLSPSDFEAYLRIAREQKVMAFKLGDLAVQFLDPGLSTGSTGDLQETPDNLTIGGWKRGPDLNRESPPDWD